MTDRILDALAKLCLRHSKLIAIVALIVFTGALAAASRLTFDPDLLNLLPRNDFRVNEFRKGLKDRGTIDNHVVMVHVPKGRNADEYDALIEEIAAGYRKSARVQSVDYRRPAPSGYLLSADREMLLILVKPKQSAADMRFARALLTEASIIDTRALSNFQKSVPAGTPLPSIEHTGGYRIAANNADLIRRDIVVTVVSMLAGGLVVFLYGFRRVAALFYAAGPIALGLAATFALAALTYRQLSSVTAGSAAMLGGLGIHFIAVLYARYVEERNRGAAMPQGLIVAMRRSLPGVVIAAIATAATFYALLATDFQGMQQLGILTGAGTLVFLLCVAFVLPALLVLSERRESSKRAARTYIHSFAASRLMASSMRKPRSAIVVWAVLLAACALLSTRVRFNDNLQDLRANDNEGIFNQNKVTKKFGTSVNPVVYLVEGAPRDTLGRIAREDAMRATLLGLAAVLLLLIIAFRSAKMVLMSLVPFVAGAVTMTGLMALFNLDFNFMNIFAPLMILGCATGYAVYVLDRYREDPATFPIAGQATGKAVVLAAVTSLVGYGSLALSSYPGLRSIGYASSFGIFFCGLAAITLLPALLVSGKGERGTRNDEQLSQHPAVNQ